MASHSHPKITNGGAEIAAYRLYQALAGSGAAESWFLGCNTKAGAGRDGVALTQPFDAREYVYSPGGQFDWFRFANADERLPDELASLLHDLRPDIVHLHHYVNFGVEALLTIRRALPRAGIFMTLHEYLAICNHFGQMVKRGQFSLCDEAGPDPCHACFPERDKADFFMREMYITQFFRYVDCFIAPSEFLAGRYAAWGIARSRIAVIDNIIAPAQPLAAAPPPDSVPASTPASTPAGAPLRIGFFGQISKLKGIAVLLEAAAALARRPARISFEIFGDYRNQPQEFQDEFLAQLAKATRNVNYRGPYRQDQVDRLMRGVDAVLVPSIWWENSPVVIEEAMRNRRPVICSDIGGMREKVRDGVDGFQFPVGAGLELCYLLQRLHDDRSHLDRIRETMRAPPSVEDVLTRHLSLYDEFLHPAETGVEG